MTNDNTLREFSSLEMHLLRALMLTCTFLRYGQKKGYPVLDNHEGSLFNDIKEFSQRVSKDVGELVGTETWLTYVGNTIDQGTLQYMPDGTMLETKLWSRDEKDNQDAGNSN